MLKANQVKADRYPMPKLSSSRVTAFYPNACQYCHEDSNELKRCTSCKITAYCSKEHQILDWKSHKVICRAIKHTSEYVLYRESDYDGWIQHKYIFSLALTMNLGRHLTPFEQAFVRNLVACEVCFKKGDCFECEKCKNVWYCSKQHQKENAMIHKDVCAELKLCRLTDLYREDDYLVDLLIENSLSRVKTIEFALDYMDLNLHTLNLHIVGASWEEANSFWDFWLFREKICSVKYINLYLIGPEAIPFEPFSFPGLKISCIMHQKYYHEIVMDLPKPDMVALFNAGLHENEGYGTQKDIWKPTIKYFFRGMPILLTGYCKEEIEKDLRLLREENSECEMVLNCMQNPFFGRKPFRDCKRYTSVYYSNRFVCICKGILDEFK